MAVPLRSPFRVLRYSARLGTLGVPLTEVGRLLVNGEPAAPGCRPAGGEVVAVEAVPRPQQLTPARFVLDVHLGTLARRLRLAGVDAGCLAKPGNRLATAEAPTCCRRGH